MSADFEVDRDSSRSAASRVQSAGTDASGESAAVRGAGEELVSSAGGASKTAAAFSRFVEDRAAVTDRVGSKLHAVGGRGLQAVQTIEESDQQTGQGFLGAQD